MEKNKIIGISILPILVITLIFNIFLINATSDNLSLVKFNSSFTKDNTGKVISSCTKDSDCGISGFYGIRYCKNNDLYRMYREYSCVNNNCSIINYEKLFDKCTTENLSEVGECKEIIGSAFCSKYIITCFDDSQCIGEKNYCVGNSVYQNKTTKQCKNPGTANSYCGQVLTFENKKIQDCYYGCNNGNCIGGVGSESLVVGSGGGAVMSNKNNLEKNKTNEVIYPNKSKEGGRNTINTKNSDSENKKNSLITGNVIGNNLIGEINLTYIIIFFIALIVVIIGFTLIKKREIYKGKKPKF